MFIVIRSGVYMQGIFGVYSCIENAEVAMKKAKSMEKDKYHEFEIEEVWLDKQKYYGGYMIYGLPEGVE